MKLILDRDALLAAMSRVGSVARKSTIPILSNVLLDATHGLTLTATDLEMQSVVLVPADIETAGRITVPASQLSEIAKSLPEGAQIKAELVEARLHVSGGRARWKLPTLPAEMFPDLGEAEWAWQHAVTGTMLADVIGRVLWAACSDQSKQFLAGVRLSVAEGELIVMATQGRDLAVARMDLEAPDFAGLTIPTVTCQEIIRLAGEAPDVTLSLCESRIGVSMPGASFTSKVIGEAYLATAKLLQLAPPDAITVDRRMLSTALRRAMIGTDAGSLGHSVRFAVADGIVSISGRSAHSEGADEIEADYVGPEHVIGMNAESMMQALGSLKSDTATIRCMASNAMSPLIVEVDGDDSVRCMCAPQKAAG